MEEIMLVKKFLSMLMALSGIVTLLLAAISLFSFKLTAKLIASFDTPQILQLITIIGVCLLFVSTTLFLGAYLIWKDIWVGILISRFAGTVTVLAGGFLSSNGNRLDLGIVCWIIGFIILVLSGLVIKE